MAGFRRPSLIQAEALLHALDEGVAEQLGARLAGGIRLAMEFDKHRNTVDLDIFAGDWNGWRALRGRLLDQGLLPLFRGSVIPVRDARHRASISSQFLKASEESGPMKVEVVHEDAHPLGTTRFPGLPIPAVDPVAALKRLDVDVSTPNFAKGIRRLNDFADSPLSANDLAAMQGLIDQRISHEFASPHALEALGGHAGHGKPTAPSAEGRERPARGRERRPKGDLDMS